MREEEAFFCHSMTFLLLSFCKFLVFPIWENNQEANSKNWILPADKFTTVQRQYSVDFS